MTGLMKPKGSVSLEQAGELVEAGTHLAVLKVDGISGSVVVEEDGTVQLFKLQNDITDKFPPLRVPALANTEFQVEWCATDAVSFVHAREYAATLVAGGYEQVVDPTLFVLNVTRYKGSDLVELTYNTAKTFDRSVAELAEHTRIEEDWPLRFDLPYRAQTLGEMEAALEAGCEGFVLYPLDHHYLAGKDGKVLKLKPQKTVDAWVYGYQPGGGKYAETVGALKFGLWMPDGTFKHLGKCSGMTDDDRNTFRDMLDAGWAFCIQVKFQRWSRSGTGILHPQFDCVRNDKVQADCLYHDQRMQSDPVYYQEHKDEESVVLQLEITVSALRGSETYIADKIERLLNLQSGSIRVTGIIRERRPSK